MLERYGSATGDRFFVLYNDTESRQSLALSFERHPDLGPVTQLKDEMDSQFSQSVREAERDYVASLTLDAKQLRVLRALVTKEEESHAEAQRPQRVRRRRKRLTQRRRDRRVRKERRGSRRGAEDAGRSEKQKKLTQSAETAEQERTKRLTQRRRDRRGAKSEIRSTKSETTKSKTRMTETGEPGPRGSV